jgi:chloramphenicol O-acetyltransferase type A
MVNRWFGVGQFLSGAMGQLYPGGDIYQFSSLPWIKFTHISHTLAGKSDKSNPMFDWGKYFEKDGKVLIPFSIQVHHSFIDGLHVGKFVEYLQGKL